MNVNAEPTPDVETSETIEGLLQQVREGVDWRERRLAIFELSYIKDETVLPILLDCLDDPVSDVRHAAVIALGRLGDDRALAKLLQPRVIGSPNPKIRWAVAKVLAKLGDHRIIDQLLVLAHDREWLVREAALNTLKTKIGDIIKSRTIEGALILIRLLDFDDDDVVELAMDGLSRFGNECPRLLADSMPSLTPHGCRYAVRLLGSLGNAQWVPLLIKMLSENDDIRIRIEAATALGKIGDVEAIQPLIESLKDGDDRLRSKVVEALTQFGDHVTEPVLRTYWQGENGHLKSEMMTILGATKGSRPVPLLVDNLGSNNAAVRKAAASSLILHGSDAIEPLLTVLTHENPESARCAALGVLGHIGNQGVAEKILELLQDESALVRMEAVKSLGDMKHEQAVKPLLKLAAEDLDSNVRMAALRTLRDLAAGQEPLLETALQIMKDTRVELRVEATRIAGDFVDERAIGPLIEQLHDDSQRVRFSAQNALCAQGKRAIPALLDVLRKGPDTASRAASGALACIGDASAIESIEQWLGEERDPARLSLAQSVLTQLRRPG